MADRSQLAAPTEGYHAAFQAGAAGETGTARQRILDRAYHLASRYGLEALTIGGLAADLQMSKAGIHGNFGSKQELQLAVRES